MEVSRNIDLDQRPVCPMVNLIAIALFPPLRRKILKVISLQWVIEKEFEPVHFTDTLGSATSGVAVLVCGCRESLS